MVLWKLDLTTREELTQDDLDILQLVVGQATAAIRNASMLEAEQRRSTELSGLADLAQALGSTRDAHDLFTRLVHSITPLFDVDILGFLVFNESRRCPGSPGAFCGDAGPGGGPLSHAASFRQHGRGTFP